LHWHPNPCIKNNYKIGFWRIFGQFHGEGCYFRVLHRAQTLRLYKNTPSPVACKCETGNQFILAVFFTSVVLRKEEWSNCNWSSVRLSVLYHWRNSALEHAAL